MRNFSRPPLHNHKFRIHGHWMSLTYKTRSGKEALLIRLLTVFSQQKGQDTIVTALNLSCFSITYYNYSWTIRTLFTTSRSDKSTKGFWSKHRTRVSNIPSQRRHSATHINETTACSNSGYRAVPFMKVGSAHAQFSVMNSGAVLRE